MTTPRETKTAPEDVGTTGKITNKAFARTSTAPMAWLVSFVNAFETLGGPVLHMFGQ